MYFVTIENPCRCCLRSGLPEQQQFANRADAKSEAEALQAEMKAKFCKKHDFFVERAPNGFKVAIRERG